MGAFRPNSIKVPAQIMSDEELEQLPQQVDAVPDGAAIVDDGGDILGAYLPGSQRRTEALRPLHEVGAIGGDVFEADLCLPALAAARDTWPTQQPLGPYIS